MGKRILIVGGVAGGASAAARARRLDEAAEIIIFERGPHVSFSNCSLPYYLSGIVENSADLILMSPEKFKKQFNIEARVNNEVIKIKRAEKKILVRDLETGEEYEESYDKLILSPGARPIVPASIEGVEQKHVFTVRNVVDISRIKDYLDFNKIEDIAVIGGGFIGVEVAENLRLAGKNVTLIEALDQVMSPFDYDMAQILHKEILDHGINLILNDAVVKINSASVELKSGKKVTARAVIMAIGVFPETDLAREAGLEIGETGGIKVDRNYLTNDRDIYAIGDAIEVYHRLSRKKTRLALAGPAQRQARAAIDHIYNIPHRNNGVIGSSVVKVFDINAACTGLNEKTARDAGIPYDFVYIITGDKVGLMPDSNPMHFKLLFEYPTGRILGAQAIGKGNVDKRIDVIATMILMDGSLEDLKELELCYAPPFGTARDVVNQAALVGLNLLHGRFKQVPVSKIRELVENDAFILDVREKGEYRTGHIKNAINIPLSELRDRLDEIPRDQPVYVHCRSAQRSYFAVMALQELGFENVYNIAGSYLALSYYEYYMDQYTGREKILTQYNFI
ncbi:MAG: FAD-dependent oxidoreductase [Halanaerobiales bacterium]|jgi:NADPH-dependent 2,4-dienoyl-CoA reductase/sulfur reductase-like enzyme/rhodanese-related sulfurtransferase|nr:FAD-dependent oxidoreductase [Bacillota bacterium]HOA41551.1 FAD-dependent oxidoreductase [Halanaerobiales bacterium]HPZ63658.1 FAD-dependent oxidoreductase [Halanaerobiales bacterium]HQD04910.1 FAD-dependent oxidoreductase [Halanaerobiales bacterium]